MNIVPVIDLSAFLDGSASARREVAELTDRTCREIGFLGVTGHRVPQELSERLFACTLGLDEEHFADSIDRHVSVLSAMYYPDQKVPPEKGQLRAGAHTDFGTMTIPKPDGAPGGLQVRTARGDWAPVKAPQGAFILNIGDMLARWTNDQWGSTLHREVNPPPDLAVGSERLSIGFFHQPNNDAVVECLPSCRRNGAVPKYPPVLAGDHLHAQFSSQVVKK